MPGYGVTTFEISECRADRLGVAQHGADRVPSVLGESDEEAGDGADAHRAAESDELGLAVVLDRGAMVAA